MKTIKPDYLSQTELAKIIEKSPQYINLLANRRVPPFSVAELEGFKTIVILKDTKTLQFIRRYKKEFNF